MLLKLVAVFEGFCSTFFKGDANHSSSIVSIARSYRVMRVSLEVFSWALSEKRVTNLDSVVFIQNSTNEIPTDLDSIVFVIQHTVENLE